MRPTGLGSKSKDFFFFFKEVVSEMFKNVYTPKALNSSLQKPRTEELEELYFTQLKALKCEIKKDDLLQLQKIFFKVKSKQEALRSLTNASK